MAHKFEVSSDKTKHAATGNFPKLRAFSMVEVTRFEPAGFGVDLTQFRGFFWEVAIFGCH